MQRNSTSLRLASTLKSGRLAGSLARVGDEQGQQLFRKLERTVVVGAVREEDVLPEGPKAGQRQQIGPRLGSGIGRIWLEGRPLGKGRIGRGQGAVDLVG